MYHEEADMLDQAYEAKDYLSMPEWFVLTTGHDAITWLSLHANNKEDAEKLFNHVEKNRGQARPVIAVLNTAPTPEYLELLSKCFRIGLGNSSERV